MLRVGIACCIVALFLVVPSGLDAQGAPVGFASLIAEATDSASDRPVLRLRLQNPREIVGGHMVYGAQSDTTGRVRLDSVPAGVPQRFAVACDGERRFGGGRVLDSLRTTLRPGEVRVWRVRASTAGCDRRPFRVLRGEMSGHWTSGFEESRFRLCDSTTTAAWVTFTPEAVRNTTIQWPPGFDQHDPTVFVRWEGVLIGPWTYGHMGVAAYQVEVERVLEVRKPGKADCQAA